METCATACEINSVSLTITVRVTAEAADWVAGVTVSIVRSITRFTVWAMTGDACSIRETVTMPVAMDVTKEMRSVRSTICDLEICSMFIPLEVGCGNKRDSASHLIISCKIDLHRATVNSSSSPR